MGMMQRRKGAAGEREAAAKLNEVLGSHLHRGRQYRGGPESPDLAGDLPGLQLEVKRVEALRLYPSLEQAARDAATGEVPAVMHRMNKKPWVVIVYADDLIRLLDVIDACRARVNEGGVGREEIGVGDVGADKTDVTGEVEKAESPTLNVQGEVMMGEEADHGVP